MLMLTAMRLPTGIDPRDEAPLADLTSGLMWVASGLAGLAGVALPGSDRAHLPWLLGLFGFAIAWGATSIALSRRATMTSRVRALVTAAMMPVVALALWATGGSTSHLQPLLFFTALFVAYFFPPRLAWPLVVLFCAAYCSPLLYDPRATSVAYPARALSFVVVVTGATLVMQALKRRLVAAEAEQRAMAEHDPLTGLHNRRSFDAALAYATRPARDDGDPRTALVVFDFDRFKAINDVHGHPVGDAVLRAAADACHGSIREGDCLARLGGDEFAVVAPGAGPKAAERIAAALAAALATADLPAGLDTVGATFAWAVTPGDARDATGLMECADARLMARKRAGRLQLSSSLV
jgi:diguanylate cyclase (GGDEF)-like protein